MTKTSKTKKIAATLDQPSGKLSRNQADFDRLHKLHRYFAVGYGLQAVTLLFLNTDHITPIIARITAKPDASLFLFNLSLMQILATIMAISAVYHGLMALRARESYELYLRHGENPFRWLESAFSASLVPIAIGLLAGLHDIASLVMLFALGFVTHIMGWQYERQVHAKHPQEAQRSFVVLAVTATTAWLAVGSYLLLGAAEGSTISPSLALAYAVMVAFVGGFGLILRQYGRQRGKWREFIAVEKAFVIWGFVARTLLVIILASGSAHF